MKNLPLIFLRALTCSRKILSKNSSAHISCPRAYTRVSRGPTNNICVHHLRQDMKNQMGTRTLEFRDRFATTQKAQFGLLTRAPSMRKPNCLFKLLNIKSNRCEFVVLVSDENRNLFNLFMSSGSLTIYYNFFRFLCNTSSYRFTSLTPLFACPTNS